MRALRVRKSTSIHDRPWLHWGTGCCNSLALLPGWLTGWLAGWFAAWLAGWLAGCLSGWLGVISMFTFIGINKVP